MEQLDWKNLPFGYIKTDYNIRCYYRNGKWGELEVSSSEYIPMHIAATALHYGQESFEGMKAFMGKDGDVRLFRWADNAKRMQASAEGIMMAEVPDELFHQAIVKAVQMNRRFVPPYGTGASLYLRPLLIGSGPQVGVKPAEEYMFMVFVTPVGPYFKEGFSPVDILVTPDYDRAAPLGTGHLKVGGNYSASMRALDMAHQKGFASALFLDAKEKKYIDEAGPANFFGIKDNTYITPKSPSILPSITNRALQDIAELLGMKVEVRQVPLEELSSFEEAGACGTAAVISPIKKIVNDITGESIVYSKDGKPGPISQKLYDKLVAIQNGDEPDPFGWVEVI
ncbi:MAG: branched-chain amino acid aminotransferase [Bacteroidetes bacterium]|jgi:branched-chain amino acid aminotransferase|nr:branched-chain amino acid aminotransferase [Bacteroidota bacterium]MBT3750366.1 branched-chain amino acid aminotransferase [Bacteroidota bacterium]MBT4409713.1 branched-chain amino acid aminotransferase [Bacteroidota bacterium]MBT5426235.1 branched-chain amino acid aminotransferase [Bacteroidota bacterium]MBT7091849.1 branched-chain amino acid aminotransferase [Bacteroidota bacterium]